MDESDKCESNSQPSNAAKKAIDGDISTWSGTCVPIAQSGSDGSSSRTAYWEADINSGSGKKYIVQSIAILVKGTIYMILTDMINFAYFAYQV